MKAISSLFFALILLYQVFAISADQPPQAQCNDEFVDMYLAKKSCLIDMNTDDCIQLSAMQELNGESGWTKAGATAGGIVAGGALGASIKKFLDARATNANAKKYIGALKEKIKYDVKINKFHDVIDEVYDKQVKKFYTPEVSEQVKLNSQAAEQASKRIKAAALNELLSRIELGKYSSADKEMLKEYTKNYFDGEHLFSRDKMHAKIFAKHFPTEAIAIEENTKKIDDLRRKASQDYDKAKSAEAKKTIENKFVADEDALLKELDRKAIQDPKLRTALAAYKYRIPVGVDFDSKKSSKAFWNRERENFKSKAFGKQPSSKIGKSVGAGAGVGSFLGSSSVTVAENKIQKNDLEKCKEELNLSPEELEFFKGDTWWKEYLYSPKTASDRSGHCENISLVNTEEALKDIKEKFNGQIPPGTCRMINNESARMDSVLGKDNFESDAQCDYFKAPNVKLDENEKDFTYTDPETGVKVKAPFNRSLSWPDFKEAKVYQVRNMIINEREENDVAIEDNDKTPKFQALFPRISAAEGSDGRFDLQDIQYMSKKCSPAPERFNNSFECKAFRAAMMARLKIAIFKRSCIEEQLLDEKVPKEPTLKDAEDILKKRTTQ